MYQDSLDSASRVRYQKKLQLLGLQQCPYAVNKSCLIDDVGCWPPVSWPEVHEYLVNSVGQFTNAAMKAYKSLEAYKYYSDGWVQTVFVVKETLYAAVMVLVASVMSSQRTTDKPHRVWVGVRSDGSVAVAHCTCMAGKFLFGMWSRACTN